MARMDKIRFPDQYPSIFQANDTATEAVLQARSYLTIKWEWTINKENKQFQEYKKLLQWIAFLIKYSYKQNPPLGFFDYALPPNEIIRHNPEEKWGKRTLMLMQPNYVEIEAVEKAFQQMKTKHSADDEKMPLISLKAFPEKKYIQVHHTWSYTAQKRSINKITAFAKKQGVDLTLKKHEIFLKSPLFEVDWQSNIIIRYGVKK